MKNKSIEEEAQLNNETVDVAVVKRCCDMSEETRKKLGLIIVFLTAFYAISLSLYGILTSSEKDIIAFFYIALACFIILILCDPKQAKQFFAIIWPKIHDTIMTVFKFIFLAINCAFRKLVARDQLLPKKEKEESLPLTDGEAQVKKLTIVKNGHDILSLRRRHGSNGDQHRFSAG